MKSIFRYIIFTAAASAMFVSCSKDTVVENNPGTAEEEQGLRTIKVSFSDATKVTFGGLKASFQPGDVIKLSNSTQSEDATVQVVDGLLCVTTSLTGSLTAVYPATAANVSGSGAVGTPAYKVPSVQDGTPGKAVIAVANITSPTAVFELQTALFEITPPSTVKKITITSLKTIASGARTGTAAEINTGGSDKTVITVGDGSTDLSSPIYVAFKPGVKLTDLSFDAGETVGMKGIPTSKLETRSDETVLKGKYSIDADNWHPYVTIGGLKWATMNIGATADTGTDSYGTYFSWGSVEKVYSLSGTTFTFGSKPSDARYTGTWAAGSGFAACNTPYYNGSSYGKYNTSDNKTVLDLMDDAAYVNWGGPWRMPTGGTSGEFQALNTAAHGNWVNGWKFTETSTSKTLFFPAAGLGSSITFFPGAGFYWSSSLYTGDAYYLCFTSEDVKPQQLADGCRYYGFSVRPVADQ